MKSEHRHQLETNVMAERLGDWIDKLRPYATSVAGILLFVFIAMFAWSYLTGSSSAWQNQAWDAYNDAVASPTMPNLGLLRESAEAHPGTKMQQLADITWADGQVWLATRDFLYNKAGVTEALNRATTAYQSILQSSDDLRLQNRARLGLARVYEMQNQPDKAIEEYNKVTGGFADFAKERAKHLGEKKTQEVVDWLATAVPPRRPSPTGPGTPGQTPSFSAGDVPLPSTGPANAAQPGGAGDGASIENFLQGLDLNKEPGSTPDRYGTDKAPPGDEPPAAEQSAPTGSTPATTEPTPPSDKAGTEQPKK
jgi:Tetratricopeptide repeat-like domain